MSWRDPVLAVRRAIAAQLVHRVDELLAATVKPLIDAVDEHLLDVETTVTLLGERIARVEDAQAGQ